MSKNVDVLFSLNSQLIDQCAHSLVDWGKWKLTLSLGLSLIQLEIIIIRLILCLKFTRRVLLSFTFNKTGVAFDGPNSFFEEPTFFIYEEAKYALHDGSKAVIQINFLRDYLAYWNVNLQQINVRFVLLWPA